MNHSNKPKKKSSVVCPVCGSQLQFNMSVRTGTCHRCKKTFPLEEIYIKMFNKPKNEPR